MRLVSCHPRRIVSHPNRAASRAAASTPRRILRIGQVRERTSLSKSTLYRAIAEGKSPAPVALLAGGNASSWFEDAVDAHLYARLAEPPHACHTCLRQPIYEVPMDVPLKPLSKRQQAADQRAMEEYTQLHNRLVGEFGAVHRMENALANINASSNPRKALRRSINILSAMVDSLEDGTLVVLPDGKVTLTASKASH